MAFLLEIKEVTKRFGGVLALGGVSFTVKDAQIKGLIGPNGAGKSTLLNIIGGQAQPDTGAIDLAGVRLARRSPHRVAQAGIARTFQTTRLIKGLTVLENVMIGCHSWSRTGFVSGALGIAGARMEEAEIRTRAMGALERVGLAQFAHGNAFDLPYGHQRLIEIARALASKPRLLLLDEPAAGLNPDEVAELGTLLSGLRQLGTTLLLVEHNMELVMRVCDSIVVLSFGLLIAEGTPSEIQAHSEVIRVYLGEVTSAAS